jgi:GNAT superfamily N-acetyltransferase
MGGFMFYGFTPTLPLLLSRETILTTPPQALDEDNNLIGVVVSKLEPHRGGPLRGYVAMLAVKEEYRGKGIATNLVRKAIDAMIERDADEVNPPRLSPPPLFLPSKNSQQAPHPLNSSYIDYLDCPRNRNHKHSRHKTLRAARIPPK